MLTSSQLHHLESINHKLTRGSHINVFENSSSTREENIPGQEDVFHPALSQFANSMPLLQEIIFHTTQMLPFSTCKGSIIALVDSMDFKSGYYFESHNEVLSCYNKILSGHGLQLKISSESLETTRRLIRDRGPVLGMLSRNKHEFKTCIANHLRRGDFIRQFNPMNKHLSALYRWLKSVSCGRYELFCLLEKIAIIWEEKKLARSPSLSSCKKAIGCDTQTADILITAYQLLPNKPFSTQ